jgi:DNA polymerase III psi subunit
MKTNKENEAYKLIVKALSKLNPTQSKSVIKQCYRFLSLKELELKALPTKRKSKIEQDRELHDFILSMDLEFCTQKNVRHACIDKFGADRAPSRTSLNRAWHKLLQKKQELYK